MQKEKTLKLQSKTKIYLEVNFYQVLLFQEIRQAQPLKIGLIKVDRVYQILT